MILMHLMFLGALAILRIVQTTRVLQSYEPTHGIMLHANHSRFSPVPRGALPRKNKELLVFISITSSPAHAHLRHANRFTWLLPCITSPACDYRFFIDKSQKACPELQGEILGYEDMVFRDSCELMNRHPDHINYGNSPPRDETLNDIPDYLFRRLYKIDWKVCFMRYARDNNKMAEYHVFVEDDSFVCTENLLHQLALLHDKAQTEHYHTTIFRTGTGMFDGFDDSSTIMHRDVAMTFANHYGEDGFNCTHVIDHPQSESWNASMWLSWGNSWMRLRCDWINVLRDKAQLNVIKPNVDCFAATSFNVSRHITKLAFPCSDHQIIMHHGTAGELILRSNTEHVKHTCEHMLLIDKVKEAAVMYDLWNVASSGDAFHDYSEVFLHEGDVGWLDTLQKLAIEEEECKRIHGEINEEVVKDCLFATPRQVRRLHQRTEVRKYLYGEAAAISSYNSWENKEDGLPKSQLPYFFSKKFKW